MSLFSDPWFLTACLLGKGIKSTKDKLQDTIDERDKIKSLESAVSYLSCDEKERTRRIEMLEKREKRAAICFLIVIFEAIFLIIFTSLLQGKGLNLSPVLAVVIFVAIVFPLIFSLIYGLWYSLSGKYL